MGGDKAKAKLFDQHIGNKIRELRTAAGLYQTKLGEPLGVSFQQIQKFESGRNGVSAGQLWQLCEFLNVPIASMFDDVNTAMFKVKPRRKK
jgi:transcriptional regulator with XRE-family HTH domain